MLLIIAWEPCSIASSWQTLDLSILGLIPCFVVSVAIMVSFSCSNAGWHNGPLKRLYLRGTFIFIFGFCLWLLEELGYLFACPAPFSLHSIWHITSAHGLMAWSAFLKYHRGRFFGFRVQLRGWWWCPYTIWLLPDKPEENPIIRHSQASTGFAPQEKPDRATVRRNTYCSAAVTLRQSACQARKYDVRALWRGASFHHASVLDWLHKSSYVSEHQPGEGAPSPAAEAHTMDCEGIAVNPASSSLAC